MFKARPPSTPAWAPVKLSAMTTLDALSIFLTYESLNTWGSAKVTRKNDTSVLTLAPSWFLPREAPSKQLDVVSVMQRAQDQGKSSARRPTLPSFPFWFSWEKLNPILSGFLWPTGDEPKIAYLLKNPESKLLAATT